MNNDSRISICIPAHNQADTVAETVRSALSQSVPVREVVVSDDGSTDATPEAMASLLGSLPGHERALVRYERIEQALGMGGNFDRAVRLTSGEFCIKVDSDDILGRTFAERLASLLESHPRAGWAHCNVTNIDKDGRPLDLAHTRKPSGFSPAEDVFEAYLRHNDTCHCVLFRRSAYDDCGGYRPAMITCEDWMLWLDMTLAGYGYVYVAEPLAKMRKYRDRDEIMSRRRQVFVESARKMLRFVDQQLQGQTEWAMRIPPQAALNRLRSSVAAQVLYGAVRERDPDVCRQLFEAVVAFDPSPGKRALYRLAGHLPLVFLRMPLRARDGLRDKARYLVQFLTRSTR